MITRIMSRLGYSRHSTADTDTVAAPSVRPMATAHYAGASQSRLFADWSGSNLTADAIIRASLTDLRSRSRELARNNEYARRFLRLVKNKVVGPSGITLQSRVMIDETTPDKEANRLIEDAWYDWGKKKNASVCGTISWLDMQRMFIESVARDGEVLVRKVRRYGNRHRFALQFIEADHLDHYLNKEPKDGGNRIKMGIEVDSWGRPVAYHLRVKHPGDYTSTRGNNYERVPAEDIIHAFVKERPTQNRGVPWMTAGMVSVHMVGGYAEAELTAARAEACKMGIIHTPTGEEYKGDGADTDGNVTVDMEPGTTFQLPQGYTWDTFDPSHPNGNFAAFVKACLRGVAAGWGVSYHTLANDLEGVNYSSGRLGELDDRDEWRLLQAWMIEHFCDEVFSTWLKMALLSRTVPLPAARYDDWHQPFWQPRGYAWVDPLKEQQANAEAVDRGFKTRTQVLAEQGLDLEETYQQLAREKELAEQYGLDLSAKTSGNQQPPADRTKGDDE